MYIMTDVHIHTEQRGTGLLSSLDGTVMQQPWCTYRSGQRKEGRTRESGRKKTSPKQRHAEGNERKLRGKAAKSF